MPSRNLRWLVAKDAHDLLASRAYWLLLLATSLLVGHAFLMAVESYAEMSGSTAGPAALAQGLSPLDGLVVPTFGALWLAATLLLPFVAIRMIAHERQSGAWSLLVQGPRSILQLLGSKVITLWIGWLVAWFPAGLALCLWRVAGNHLALGEAGSVILGHLLFGWLTIGVAAAAAAIMESEASAAVVTLGFTIGTWAIDFIGAERGGAIGAVARVTPGAVLHAFERGLVRPSAIAVLLVAGSAGTWIAASWLNPRIVPRRRRVRALSAVAVVGAAIALTSTWRTAWDWSEDRRNSFPTADEAAIRGIAQPLRIEIHLAPEDPRMEDLRRGFLDKIERLIAVTTVTTSRTHTGLFEQADSSYGEIWYAFGARRTMSRSTTPEIILPMLYELAGITAPAAVAPSYPGYPLVQHPQAIAPIFFGGLPLAIMMLFASYRWIGRNRTAS